MIWHRPPEGLINLRGRFDDTGKILVGQQGEEIRLELLSWDVKLLSQSRSDNIITDGRKANKLTLNKKGKIKWPKRN